MPGSYALIPPGTDPIERAGLAMLEFAAWSHNRAAEKLTIDHEHIVVAQSLDTGEDVRGGDSSAFFLHDGEPAAAREFPMWANAHDLALDELRDLAQSLPAAVMDHPLATGGRSILSVVVHAAATERWYAANLTGKDGRRGDGKPDPIRELQDAHRFLQEAVCDVAPGLRVIPYPAAQWDEYDAVLTFFDRGFSNLMEFGGADHPCIVSSLGSVVGASDDVPGMFFFGDRRKWLYGVQLGTDWAVTDKTQLRFAAAIYDFHNVEGVRESDPPPGGARAGTVAYQTSQYSSSARQKGNTLINLNDPTSTAAPVWGLASKFRPVNLSAAVTFAHLDPYLIGLSLDYVKNSAFDLADIRKRAGTSAVDDLSARTRGYQLRAQFGSPKLAERGNWQTFVALRKFERDAWVDAYTDTTWHLGGTNYKGFSVGASYALARNTNFSVRWTSTRNLDDGQRFLAVPGDPTSVSGNLSSAPLKIDVIQLEVSSRF